MRVPLGGRLLPWCRASGVGPSPTPDSPPSGRAAGADYPLALGAGGRGRGDPSQTPQRALLRAGFARCEGGTEAPGRGASCLVVGRPGPGTLPPPTARPLGGPPGPTTHWLWLRGGAGVGTRHQPHSACSCVLWGRHEGARGGRQLAWVWGVRGLALSHPRLPALWAGCRGPLPTCCGCGGVRAWGPVTNPTARALASWLCALWGRHKGARGGRLLPGYGASGVGRSPTPDCPPCRRAAGAHYPLAVGAGGCGHGDPSPTPQHALLRAGFALSGGGTRAPGGGASCLGVGRPGSCALPPPTARPLGGLPGPTTHCLGVRGGAGVGTRHQSHSARSCVLWGRHEGARVGAPLAWLWGVRGRALSHPRLPALWAGCRGPLPTGCRCRGSRAWGPVTNPTARAVACCGGGMRVPLGGRLLPGCGASGVGRSPTPDSAHSGRAAGAHYPLAVGAGGCGRGDPSPTPQRALFRAGFARCGGGTEGPGGGASCLVVGRPGSGAAPSPTASPLGGLPGPTTHWLWVRGGAGMGTRHQPHSTRSRVLWGRHEGAQGGRLLPGCGVSGVGRSPTPDCPPLWAGCRGPLPTGCGCGGPRAWGAVTNPTARALASWLCALWGRHKGARGGRLLPGCGASGVGRSPTPDCPPSGRAAGAHYPLAVGAGVCGRGDPSPTPQHALLRAGFARCGGGTRAPGGGASCLGVGRPGSGALPPPTARPMGGLRGPTTHWRWVRVGAGVGTRHQPHSARSCVLWGRHEGARGGRLLPGCGASGVGRFPIPDCPPSRRAAGAHYPLAVAAGG